MVGGGPGAFIGSIHRKAAAMDGAIELVCGAFSSNSARSGAMGKELGLEASRSYGNYSDMIQKEKALPPDQKMDFVSIVTPNHVHFAPARLALESGFHVIMDKPMTLNLAEAKKLHQLSVKTKLVVALTHTYTGYPMVKEARNLVASGKLGPIRKVFVEYAQGWLSSRLEDTGHKQAGWRTNPKLAGAGAIGDIGTHAANLAEYILGSRIDSVCAQLNSIVKGRKVDDDAAMLIKFTNKASGLVVATQVAAGEENDLAIRIYGEKGGIEWKQEEPNSLEVKWLDRPKEIYRSGRSYLSQEALGASRTPSGHPEGYLEAFANIYGNFARAIRDHQKGKLIDSHLYDFPSAEDGVHGMGFIEAAKQSSQSGQKWIKIDLKKQ